MLAATAAASPPFALIPLTTSSQAGSLRLETTTLAPCAAICSQIARPMPRLPPVTTATLPVRSNIFVSMSVLPGEGEKLLPDIARRHVVAKHAVLAREAAVRLHGGAEQIVE